MSYDRFVDIEKCPNCARLEARVAELEARNAEPEEIIRQLIERCNALEARVKELEAQLHMNSTNSSKPPSSDGLAKPTKPGTGPKTKSGRVPSGQPPGGREGHPGSTLDTDGPAGDTINLPVADACPCGADLTNVPAEEGEIRRVFELPALQFDVVDYRGFVKTCPCCGERVKSRFPDHAPARAQYGPGILAFIAYVRQFQMLPLERTADLVEDFFGLRPSEATILNAEKRLFDLLAPFEADTIDYLRKVTLRHLDETGFRVAEALFWIHVACTESVAFFGVHANRGRVAFDAFGVLEGAVGAICHDGLPTYFTYENILHVLCNAHHLRELTFVHDELGERWAGAMRQLLVTAKQLVDRRAEEGRTLTGEEIDRFIARYGFIVRSGRVLHPEPVRRPGQRGRLKRAKGANLAIRLEENSLRRARSDAPRLDSGTGGDNTASTLAFLVGMPFTNNVAERDQRMIKIREKISGCLRTLFGAQVFARIRGYLVTARKNAVNMLEALKRAFNGEPFTLEQMLEAPA